MRKGAFSPQDARAFYNRFGKKQDWQAFYENPAVNELISHADFGHAKAVIEFGFGTARLAERLLSQYLPGDAAYQGIDISETMARLAEKRLERWKGRAAVRVHDGTRGLDFPDRSFDQFVSVYVLDLLNPEQIKNVLTEARRILKPGGRLCLVSLTRGTTAWSRAVTRVWEFAYRRSPRLVGGCRPVELLDYIGPEQLRIDYRNIVSSFGIASEVVVASPL